jgi:hypothetical protein
MGLRPGNPLADGFCPPLPQALKQARWRVKTSAPFPIRTHLCVDATQGLPVWMQAFPPPLSAHPSAAWPAYS